jgi:hypothetical protein
MKLLFVVIFSLSARAALSFAIHQLRDDGDGNPWLGPCCNPTGTKGPPRDSGQVCAGIILIFDLQS